MPELLSVDLAYTNRGRPGRFELGDLPTYKGFDEVLTIRGDLRDVLAARRIFHGATVKATGWFAFAARRSAVLDAPFSLGWLPTRNRYRAWCKLAGLPWKRLHVFYRERAGRDPRKPIVIHLGAQWRSKQYPHVAELCHLLRDAFAVRLVSGGRDPLPAGVHEHDVVRVKDAELVDTLRDSSLVIVNDSGPMHLAAFLRCQVLAISRVSGIAEWLPPFVQVVAAAAAPRGYRPAPKYMSDEILGGWPLPSDIVPRVNETLSLHWPGRSRVGIRTVEEFDGEGDKSCEISH